MSVTHSTKNGARGSTAAAVRSQRARLDLTQAQVAEALGLHPSSVSLKEHGKVPFTVDELYQLANFFRVPIESFFSRGSRFDISESGQVDR